MEWISIKDRLPEDVNDRGYIINYLCVIDSLSGAYVRCLFYLDTEFVMLGDYCDTIYHNVTHWQPVPKPPKK